MRRFPSILGKEEKFAPPSGHACLNIRKRVAYQHGGGKIDFIFFRCLHDHARMRFAQETLPPVTADSMNGMERAVENIMDNGAMFLKLLLHPVHKGKEIFFGIIPSADAGLIGYDDDQISFLVGGAHQRKNVFHKDNMFLLMHITKVHIDNAITIKEKGLVKGHGNFPVYIDSPLAIEATRIFKDTDPDCFDADTRALLEKGIDPITFPGLRVTVTSDESRMINADRVPKVILSASGMCEAGRIRHHLKHNLWRKECTILFVGYQAVSTLGRSLLEGATNVKLFGESIEVQAEICQLTGLSGHADREGLLKWVNSFEPKPKRVFVIHGEDEVENIFTQTLTEQGFTACAPYNGEQWAIGAEGAVCLKEGTRTRIEHRVSEGAARAATVFQRLLSAGKRLLRVIEHNEGGTNKDLAKFADQINALCDKWDR